MTVSMGIMHINSGRYDVVPVATNEYFIHHWLPACAQLGLRFVAHFHDGALATVATEDIQKIIEELETLRAWAREEGESAFMIERIDGLLRSLQETASDACQYDFG